MGVTKRAEPGGVLVFDRDAVGAQLVDGGRQVLRVPQRDRVDDKTKSRQLVLTEMILKLSGMSDGGSSSRIVTGKNLGSVVAVGVSSRWRDP
ncbi:hypothetical protein, partial [Nonomuraea cypriaca]|uniref:hypothetical protein n=1 Tax=Nonomuraea cypriaca TaxID=1187855 RepID=UPI0038B35EE3